MSFKMEKYYLLDCCDLQKYRFYKYFNFDIYVYIILCWVKIILFFDYYRILLFMQNYQEDYYCFFFMLKFFFNYFNI